MVLIRPAKQADAPLLAELVDMAGAGLPAYLWSLLGEHTDNELDVGAARIARPQGTMSHSNIRVALISQKIAGMMHGYHLQDQDDVGPLEDYPEFLRPLLELESLSSTAWYHNALATFEEFRGRGVGTALMNDAEDLARAAGADEMRLIVASTNTGAKRIYDRLGYHVIATRQVVPIDGLFQRGDWLLMAKNLSPST